MPDSEDAYDSSSSSDSSTRKKPGMSDKTKGRLRAAGDSLRSFGQDESDQASSISQSIRPVAYKRGGKVRKTGPAIVHRGERVIPAGKRRKAEKAMKRAGMRLTNKKGRKSSGR
jgi:SLT domain-containing protein